MAHPQQLSNVLVDFAKTLVRSHNVADVLGRLMEGVVNVLGVWGAGVSLDDGTGRLRLVSATDDVVQRLQALEDDVDRGPCREAYDSGVPIVVRDLGAVADRWPRLVAQASAAGINAVMGIPMVADGACIGALNVYDADPAEFDEDTVATAQVLADVATGYIVNVRDLDRARELTAQLQTALDSRVLIEQAKGYLAGSLHIDVETAFEILRSYSRNQRINIHDVAAGVVDGTLLADNGTLRDVDAP